MLLEFTSDSLHNFRAFQMTAVFIAVCSCLLFIYTGYNGHTIYDLQKMKDDINVDISHKKTTNESYLYKNTYSCKYWHPTIKSLSNGGRNYILGYQLITNYYHETVEKC
jgi:hypothetical protein